MGGSPLLILKLRVYVSPRSGTFNAITSCVCPRFIDRKGTPAINLTPTRYLATRIVNCVRVHTTESKCYRYERALARSHNETTVLIARNISLWKGQSRFKNPYLYLNLYSQLPFPIYNFPTVAKRYQTSVYPSSSRKNAKLHFFQ